MWPAREAPHAGRRLLVGGGEGQLAGPSPHQGFGDGTAGGPEAGDGAGDEGVSVAADAPELPGGEDPGDGGALVLVESQAVAVQVAPEEPAQLDVGHQPVGAGQDVAPPLPLPLPVGDDGSLDPVAPSTARTQRPVR